MKIKPMHTVQPKNVLVDFFLINPSANYFLESTNLKRVNKRLVFNYLCVVHTVRGQYMKKSLLLHIISFSKIIKIKLETTFLKMVLPEHTMISIGFIKIYMVLPEQ